jgi:cytoskeletal protein RodZ
MTDQFAFLGDKHKLAIAAISLGVLLLLPASLGFGGTIIQEAFGQFNLPLLEEEEETAEETEEENGGLTVEEEGEEDTTTMTTTTPPVPSPNTTTTPPVTSDTIQDLSMYLLAAVNTDALRGLVGSTLPAQDAAGNAADDDSGYIATGRFRLFANETLIRRFITEMNVAAIDGSSFHNITITQGSPHRFAVTAGNGTTGASSSIVGSVYLDGGATPVIDNVPMTLTVRGQSLAIEGINIDETRITDPGQRDIVSAIDGQTIYGIVMR